MPTVEINSYPKSGNTWLCRLVNQLLVDSGASNVEVPRGIHAKKDHVINKRKFSEIPGIDEPWSFYKSHVTNHPDIKPEKILYIYRHPLDVFLSTLNFFYHKDLQGSLDKKRAKDIFLKGIPKSCEEIQASGEMDKYFQTFLKAPGENFFPGMLGENSNYFRHVSSALKIDKVIPLKYEELIDNAENKVKSVMSELLEHDFSSIEIDTALVDRKTKYSKNKTFYWKAISGTRYEFLTHEQIKKFEDKYEDPLSEIGYLQLD